MLGTLGGLGCCGLAVGALLLLEGSPFGHFGEVLALKDGFGDIEAAVAGAVLGYVGVSVVTGADDVSVNLQIAGS